MTMRRGTGGGGRGTRAGSGDGVRERAKMLESDGMDMCFRRAWAFSRKSGFTSGWAVSESGTGGGGSQSAMADADSLSSVSPTL